MIGEEVRRRREELGLTGAQLAERANMAPSAVSQIETGKRSPSSNSVVKLANALGVEVGDLFPKAQVPLSFEAFIDEEDRRRLDSGEVSEPRHPNVHELLKRIQEMRLVERRRRNDIERMDSPESAHELDRTRVWEWDVFDHALRAEYGDFVDSVNNGAELESSDMQRLCLEFSGQLSTLENLSAQAAVIAGATDTEFFVATEKAAHELQKDLQENHEVKQEVEK